MYHRLLITVLYHYGFIQWKLFITWSLGPGSLFVIAVVNARSNAKQSKFVTSGNSL